jgi:tetratricopeptide (TPR) repeat protein
MKINSILGSAVSLTMLLAAPSHSAILESPQVESKGVNWIAESEDEDPCKLKKGRPAKYYYEMSMRAFEPSLEMSCLNTAIKLDRKYVDAYDRRGNAKRKNGNLKGAIADYTMAVKINPKYGYSFYNRAIAKEELKDKKGAIADYIKAIEIFRQNDQTDEMEMATKNLEELKNK